MRIERNQEGCSLWRDGSYLSWSVPLHPDKHESFAAMEVLIPRDERRLPPLSDPHVPLRWFIWCLAERDRVGGCSHTQCP